MKKILFAALLAGGVLLSFGQRKKEIIEFAPLHLGVVQGMGTNGVYDLKYENNVALNLLSGQSYGNNILCISGVSHFQLQKAQGIYLSGVTSIIGATPFLTRKEAMDSLATFNAIQMSGFGNLVNGSGEGAQVSGVFNSMLGSVDGFQFSSVYNNVGGSFTGFQLGMVANRIKKYGIGVQSALLLNTAKDMSGAQVFAVFNTIENDLDGVQIGLFNRVGNAKSVVYRSFKFYWLQLGLINSANQNGDGTQIGLINYGKNIGFSQLGIINISNKVPQYPIGFLNIAGDAQSFLRGWMSRAFRYSIEIGTGSRKIMNGASYSFDPEKDRRAIGWAIGNQLKGGYKKNEFFFDYYLTVTQVKEQAQSFLDPNFIYGAKIEFGFNSFMRTKLPWMFFFVGCSANAHKVRNGKRLVTGNFSGQRGDHERWLDFHFGIQF